MKKICKSHAIMYSKRYDVIKVYVVGGGGVQQPTGPQSRFVEGLLGGGGCNNQRGHSLGL